MFYVAVLLSFLSTSQQAKAEATLERSGPKEFSVPLAHEKLWTSDYRKFAQSVMQVMGKDSCPTQPQNCQRDLAQLDRLISENPKEAFLHSLKAMYLLISKAADLQQVIKEIDLGLPSPGEAADAMAIPNSGLLQMRAKANLNNAAYDLAVDDLMKAVTLTGQNFVDVFNTGGVKPTDSGNPTSMNGADFDTLVQHLPGDWRPLAMRGLFKLSFWRFGGEAINNSLSDLNEAMSLAPNESKPKRFLAYAYENAAFQEFNEQQKAMLNQRAIQMRRAALKSDPQSVEDSASLGQDLLDTGQLQGSIEYFSRAIAINPKQSVNLNGRGVAEKNAGKFAEAVQDFTAAIAILQPQPKKESSIENNYEHRAEANQKLGKTALAIEDYGSAIGYQLANSVFLMSLAELRDLYPELADIPDTDLLEQLRVRYDPQMDGATFSNQVKNNKKYETFLLGDLYSARANAEKAIGDDFSANKDFARAAIMVTK